MNFDKVSFESSEEFKYIEKIYDEIRTNIGELTKLLVNHPEYATVLNDYRQQYTKIFLIASATSFEKKIISFLPELLHVKHCPIKNSFLSNKFTTRDYSKLFNWSQNNTNNFLSSFGDKLVERIKGLRAENVNISKFEKSFLQLGNLRNNIAHAGIIPFSWDKELESAYELFKEAKEFISIIFKEIDELIVSE